MTTQFCNQNMLENFAQTNRPQLMFWSMKFGMAKGSMMAIRVQVITCYLEHYQILLISRPDQLEEFLKILKKRREKMEVTK